MILFAPGARRAAIADGVGVSIAQGAESSASINAAPLRRITRSSSDSASIGFGLDPVARSSFQVNWCRRLARAVYILSSMTGNSNLDLIIIGGGVGGVICLKYAKDAGLKTLLLERRERIGGLWRDLPAWQDIQFRKEDWTLGDIPLSGERQPDILRNIEAWAESFELSPYMLLNAPVTVAK